MPASGGGVTPIDYTVAANPGGPRTADVSIGTRTLTVLQAGTCNFGLTPTSRTVSGAGGSSDTSIGVNGGCPWDATTAAPWITIENESGTGPGTLSFTVAENTGAARVGTIDVEGTTLTVNQNAACSYALGAASLDVAASAGTQMVSVTTQLGCPITGVSDVAWITPQASGTGSGTTSFQVAANSGAARSGIVTIGGETITVNQASGCTISLPASSTTVSSAGASSSFLVSTGAGCEYTAQSDAAWLSATPGAGGVDFTAEASASGMRVGTITVTSTSTDSSADYLVTQSSGCIPALASPGEARDAEGGVGSFGVTIDGACTYSATPDVPWIHSVAVTAAGVEFAVDTNEAVERAGAIEVASTGGSVSYAITQSNGCTVSVQDAPLVLDPQGNASDVDVITGEGCEWDIEDSTSWFEVIPAATSMSIFSTANLDVARTGTVTVRATGSGATDVLEVQQASAIPPPVITQQPADQRVFVGELVGLIVNATVEGGDLTYQWRKDGEEIPLATHNALWLSDVTLEDAGDYDVLVIGVGGSVVSNIATLDISEPSGGGCAIGPGGSADGGPVLLVLAGLAVVGFRRRQRR